MRILYTSASSDIRRIGIFETRFLELAKNLTEIGNELLVLVTAYTPRDGIDHGLNVKFIPSGRPRLLSYLLAEFLRIFYMPFLIWKWQPHVIYSRRDRFEFFPPIWARLFRVPYVTEAHGVIEVEATLHNRSRFYIRLLNLAENLACVLATRVICVASTIRDQLAAKYHVEETKLVVISNGANTDFFRPLAKTECRRRLGLESNAFYVGFVGTFLPWHELETLVDAARRVKEQGYSQVKFQLVGEGTQKPALMSKVRQYGLERHIQFTGRAPYELVPVHMNAFDVCYISIMNYQGAVSPLKLYEYLACGRPVIAGRVEGLTQVIEEGRCGYLFEPGNAGELVERILQSASPKAPLDEMGRNGRRLVEEKYSWRCVANSIMAILQQIRA